VRAGDCFSIMPLARADKGGRTDDSPRGNKATYPHAGGIWRSGLGREIRPTAEVKGEFAVQRELSCCVDSTQFSESYGAAVPI
jgi:hypothetical protein